MNCSDVTNICAESQNSRCVDFEGTLGNNTSITSDCVNQHQVNEDLYTITDNTISNSDATTALETNCLTYPITDEKILPKSALEVHGNEICSIGTRVTTLENIDYSNLDITSWNLDFRCLVDPCGDPITTLGQLIQIMINKDCE